ncbi:hypothetical protein BCR39DRAFT_540206 [Naematelia encephala]|uniref:MPN domain-containing protein n=1 Tax=Naematelia encephala TaxID=71784 RepID=A0A1Y2AY19_9TREE|nr:hypothetical protein BCR39DRAFT_540206 [Naematelia encephala]
MTSMAAALAASLPQPAPVAVAPNPSSLPNGGVKVPQRMEGAIDVDASREVESVQLSSLVFMKIMKHSTDTLTSPSQHSFQTDLKAPPTTALGSRTDAVGVLLGLDLDGVMEVEDCFALPTGETSVGATYSSRLLQHLREVQTPDSPVGVYLSTHNGGSVTRAAIDLLSSVEKAAGRGKAILIVHDAAKASGGDLSVKAYRLSDAAREAASKGKWDTASLVENKITSSNLLTTLPVNLASPTLIAAFLATLTASTSTAPKPSLATSSVPLPPSFSVLTNPLPTSLPAYLSDTLDSVQLHQHEANNVAFLMRQIGREKARHEGNIKEREEENIRRRKQGLPELPSLPAEMRGGTKEPSRLELLCLQGQVDALAKGMGAEAGKGLVRCYL